MSASTLCRSASLVGLVLMHACSVDDSRDFDFGDDSASGGRSPETPGGQNGGAVGGGAVVTGGAMAAGGFASGASKATGGTATAYGGASGGRATATGGSKPLDCSAPSTANELTPRNGWVARDGNCAGIQGLFWTAHDEVSTILPAEAAEINLPVCLEATLGQVVDDDFDVYWGATLGLSLNQLSPSEMPAVYDAAAHGVAGFRFTLSGAKPPPVGRLRFNIIAADESIYCVLVAAGDETTGTFEVFFEQLRKSCWDADSEDRLDPSAIRVAQFNLVTSISDAPSYSFCVDSLSAIRAQPGS